MSLKAFHVVFISISTLMCALCAAWALRVWQLHQSSGALVGALGSLAGAAALLVYGRWFYRKLGRPS